MRKLRFLMLALLSVPLLAQAATAIFYQPQLRDRSVAAEAWPGIFASARSRGFDTLVVQWTRHGEAFTGEDDRNWLKARLNDARAADLKLIIGLAADPDGNARLKQPGEALDGYFRGLIGNDLELARYWRETLGADAIDGWYLTTEIDDFRWRDDKARSSLKAYLDREASLLGAVAARPVYASSYFGGNMAPERYAEMISGLTENNHLNVWVQDGAGTGKLSAAGRALYLDAVSRCPNPAARGIVYELFRQTGPDTAFKAEALPAAQAEAIAARRAPCNGDSVFFSLRYLPGLPLAIAG